MQSNNSPAKSSADDVQSVKVRSAPVVLRVRIRVERPQAGGEFSFGVCLGAEHQDMPGVSIYTGGAHVMLYPKPEQARIMAGMLMDLAEAAERAGVSK